MGSVDVVIVSYNSAKTLRSVVEPLAGEADLSVTVVDNASADHSVDSISGLRATVLRLAANFGFAHGCNRGSEAGSAPFVLFLNPDCRIDPTSVRKLAAVFQQDSSVGLVAPLLVDGTGELDFSQRRFPCLRSTFAQALFLHRCFPQSTWVDEAVRDPDAYRRQRSVDWVSGACVLVRRSALERIGGWNENFFLYGEDIDLCARLASFGYDVRFEPGAKAIHQGGSSAPRAQLLPTLTESRLRYGQLHFGTTRAATARLGVAIGELTHAVLTTKGRQWRRGHLSGFRVACSSIPTSPRPPASVPPAAVSQQ